MLIPVQYRTIKPKRTTPVAPPRAKFLEIDEPIPDLTAFDLVYYPSNFSDFRKFHPDRPLILERSLRQPHKIMRAIDAQTGKAIRQQPRQLNADNYPEHAEYFAAHGARFTSPTNVAQTLFAQGLVKPLRFRNNIGRNVYKASPNVFPKDRLELTREIVEHWDIKSAYYSAMFADNGMIPVRTGNQFDAEQWRERRCIVLAIVHMSRNRPQPFRATHSGNLAIGWFWDFELRTAENHGHGVEPKLAVSVFWRDASSALERMDTVLRDDKISKWVRNSLWGSLMTGALMKTTQRIDKDNPAEVVAVTNPLIATALFSSWVNALVNDKAYREYITVCKPIYFDTDGGLSLAGTKPNGYGWELKGRYDYLRIDGWQAWAGRKALLDRQHGYPFDLVLAGRRQITTYPAYKREVEGKERRSFQESFIIGNEIDTIHWINAVDDVTQINVGGAHRNRKEWLRIAPALAPEVSAIIPKSVYQSAIAKRLEITGGLISRKVDVAIPLRLPPALAEHLRHYAHLSQSLGLLEPEPLPPEPLPEQPAPEDRLFS